MAEDTGNESQFTEMLRIEIDVASFQQQLGVLKDAYKSFIAELSAMGGPAIPLMGGGDSAAALQQIKESAVATQQAVRDTLVAVETLGKGVTDAVVLGFDGLLETVKGADVAISVDAAKTATEVGAAFKKAAETAKASLEAATESARVQDADLARVYAKDADTWQTILLEKQRMFAEYQANQTRVQEQAAAARIKLTEAETALAFRKTEIGPAAIGPKEVKARENEIVALREDAKAKEQVERENESNILRMRLDASNADMARQRNLNASVTEYTKEQVLAFKAQQDEAVAASERTAAKVVAASQKVLEARVADDKKALLDFNNSNEAMLLNEKTLFEQMQLGSQEYFNQLSVSQQKWIAEHAHLLANLEVSDKEYWESVSVVAKRANDKILEIEQQRVAATKALAKQEAEAYAAVQYRGGTRVPETAEVGARQDVTVALRSQIVASEAQLKELQDISKQTEGTITADKLAELEKRLTAVAKAAQREMASVESSVQHRTTVENAANQNEMDRLQQLGNKQNTFREQLVAGEAAAQAKLTELRVAAAAVREKLDERQSGFGATEAQVNATKRLLTAYQEAITKVEALFKELQDVGTQAAENINTAFTEQNAKMVASTEASLGRVQAGLDRVITTEQRGGETTGFFARVSAAVKSLPADLAETAVSLTKIMVLWGLIGEAIRLVMSAITALPRALEAGFTFLGLMQEKAVELQAVIAQTTHLADGFGNNFKAAGVASEAVIEQLRIKAVQLGLDFEKLVVTFKNLSEGGAPSMLKNLQEQVDLTTTLELAMRAVASDQQESRRIQQEIPKLLDGTIDDQSRFLHVVHMTKEEWNELVILGMQHHDLLQRIQERLKEFVEAGKSLPGTWDNLVKQAQLFFTMVEASLAQPLFVEMNRLLQDTVKYFLANREAIQGMAKDFGEVIKNVVVLTEDVAKLSEAVITLGGHTNLLKLGWGGVGNEIDRITRGLDDVIKLVTTISGIGLLSNIDFSKFDFQHPLESLQKFGAEVKKVVTEVNDDTARKREQKDQEEYLKELMKQQSLTQSIEGSPAAIGRNTKAAADAHKAYTDALKAENELIEKNRIADAALVQSRGMSQDTATNRRVQGLKDEEKAVLQLGYKYAQELVTNPQINAKTRNDALKELQTEQAVAFDKIHKEMLQARTQATTDAFRREEAAYSLEVETIRSKYTQLINASKEAQQSHTVSVSTGVAQRKVLYQKEVDELNAAINKAEAKFKGMGVVHSDTIFDRLKKDSEALPAKLSTDVRGEDKELQAEQDAVDKIHYKARLDAAADFNKHQQALIKAGMQDNLISATEGLNRLEEVEAQSYAQRRKIIEDEIRGNQKEPKVVEEAIAKIAALDRERTFQLEANVIRRSQALEKEQKARDQIFKEQAALSLKETEINIQSAGQFVIAEKQLQLIKAVTAAKIREAEVNIEVARTELLNAAAKGATLLEMQKLENALRAAQDNLRSVATNAANERRGTERGSTTAAQDVAYVKQINQNIAAFRTLYTVTQMLIQGDEQKLTLLKAEVAQLEAAQAQAIGAAAIHPEDAALQQAAKAAADALAKARAQVDATAASLDTLHASLDAADKAIRDEQDKRDATKLSWDNIKDALQQTFPVLKLWKQLHEEGVPAVIKFKEAIQDIGSTIHSVIGIIGAIQQGRETGGTAGMIGAGLGQVGGMISMVNPVIGGIVSGVGEIFSFVGQMFQKAAARIANDIKLAIQQITNAMSNGDTSLAQTITALEAQRQKAISELSGKKGGQKQLNQILPGLDQQIAQLLKQQRDILNNFNQMVTIGRQNTSELQNFLQTWVQINKQAADYISAGGSVKVAQQYIEQQLKQQQLQAQDQFLQGEQQAIQDALHLNDLYKQAVQLQQQKFDLVKNEKAIEFGIETKDSIERRIPQAVQIANQLTTQRQQFAQQLQAINDQQQSLQYELTIQSEKVAKEQKMYNLATDIAGLHRQDEALSNYFLDEQLNKTAALKAIMMGIYSAGPYELLTQQFKNITGIGKYFQNDNPYFAYAGNLQGYLHLGNPQQLNQNPMAPPVGFNPNAQYLGPPKAGPIGGDASLTAAIQLLALDIKNFNQTLPGNIANAIPSIAQLIANVLTNPFVGVGKSMDLLTMSIQQLEAQIVKWLASLGLGGLGTAQAGQGALAGLSKNPVGPPTPSPLPNNIGDTLMQLVQAFGAGRHMLPPSIGSSIGQTAANVTKHFNFGQITIQNNGQAAGPEMADAFMRALESRFRVGTHV